MYEAEEAEMSGDERKRGVPLHLPPLQRHGATTCRTPPWREIGLRKRNAVKRGSINISRSSWVPPVETRNKTWGMNAIVRDPAIMTSIVTLPFNQVFQAAVAHPTVKNIFDLEFFISAY
jgi:hypothetical protein